MSRIKYDDQYSYELFDDGYDIYDYDQKIISQHDPYGKVFDKSKSYEENCIIQLDQMTAPPAPPEPPAPTPEEKLRSDVDYLSLMLDVPLPSEEEEGE